MIGALYGKPIKTEGNSIIMMVHDVGYSVMITASFYSKIQEKDTFVYTFTNVKQDALELFGFQHKNELVLFKMLLGVSGIGPRTAIVIIDFGIENIYRAIASADVSFFTQIPKVGKKMAQKIIIELKSKIGSLSELDLSEEDSEQAKELVQSLVAMGFEKESVRSVFRKMPEDIKKPEEKMRYALKELGIGK